MMKSRLKNITKVCEWCGKIYYTNKYKAATSRFCGNSCSRKATIAKLGCRSTNWKGGVHQQSVYFKLHPEIQAARNETKRAIRSGILVPSKVCVECNTLGTVEAHHEDYTTPLNVLWLCKPCHIQADRIRRLRSA